MIFKSAISYLYLLALTSKKFGVFQTIEMYLNRDVLRKQLVTFKPKSFLSPVYLRKNSSDWNVFQEVFFRRNSDVKVSFSPEVIIDCGANIGLVSLYFMQKYPGVKLIAIEPEENNYKLLVSNLKAYKNFIPIKGGVWNKSTYLEVVDTVNMGSWGFSCNEIPEFKEGAVKAYSVSEIMSTYDIDEIDILKLDIEGAELELFTNNYESWLPQTKCIIIELHDWRRKGCSKVFFSALFHYDFSIYTKGETIVCCRNN